MSFFRLMLPPPQESFLLLKSSRSLDRLREAESRRGKGEARPAGPSWGEGKEEAGGTGAQLAHTHQPTAARPPKHRSTFYPAEVNMSLRMIWLWQRRLTPTSVKHSNTRHIYCMSVKLHLLIHLLCEISLINGDLPKANN